MDTVNRLIYNKIFLSISLMLGVSIYAQASDFYFNHLTTANGMVSNRVTCIYQDNLGFMWFGTLQGLSMYDGYSFKNYANNPEDSTSISNNEVLCILEDEEQNLWVGTTNGLNYFNRSTQKFTRFYNNSTNSNSISDNYIRTLVHDTEPDCLWVGTSKGLNHYNTSTHENRIYRSGKHSDSLSNDNIYAIFPTDSTVWISTHYSLNIYNKKTAKFAQNSQYDFRRSRNIKKDSKYNIWLCTMYGGLIKYPNGNINAAAVSYNTENSKVINDRPINIEEDKYGNYYVIFSNGGLCYLETATNSFTSYEHDSYNTNSISTNALSCLYKSKEDIIWIGTYNRGVDYSDPKRIKFKHFNLSFKENGLFNENIRSLFEDSEGNIWVGTKDKGGVSRFNKHTGEFINYKSTPDKVNGLKGDFILSINEYNERYLLIGTYLNSLFLMDKRKETFSQMFFTKDSVPLYSTGISHIHKDLKGQVWMTNYNMLFKYTFNDLRISNEVYLENITCICNQDEENMWVGTQANGLFLINTANNSLTNYLSNNSDSTVASNKINSIAKDKSGNLWIATNNGLSRLVIKTKKITNYNTSDGLPINYISHVLVDNDNSVWISTTRGISKFDASDRTFINYDVVDGLKGTDFCESVGIKTKDGELIFGGSNGFYVFKPEEITCSEPDSRVELTDLKIFNKSVMTDTPGSVLSKHISNTKEIELSHKHQVFTIEYTVLNYSDSKKNKYAYKLDNLESEWNYVGAKRSATYTNLNPGNYIFMVMSSTNGKDWKSEPSELKITVLPPFWATWWFRGVAILFVVTLVLIIFLIRVNQLKRQKEKLEHKVKTRTRDLLEANAILSEQREEIGRQRDYLSEKNEEILKQSKVLKQLNKEIKEVNKLKLRFFTNISHEFRTPLTLIVSPVEKLLSLNKNDFNPEVWELFQIMKRNSQRLLHLINRLMDFRKLEQGKMELNLEYRDIISFITEIKSAFNSLSQQQNIDFVLYSGLKELSMDFDPAKLEMVIYNLLSNAFKFTPQNGKIEIQVSEEIIEYNKFLNIAVADTGVGLSPDHRVTIFERFAQIENSEVNRIAGSGIGLALTKDLLELHNGSIAVESELNKGSVFPIKLPVQDVLRNKQKNDNSIKTRTSSDNGRLSYLNKEKLDMLSESLMEFQKHKEEKTRCTEIKLIKGKPTLFVVDDNADIRSIINQEFCGEYNVVEAVNGFDGLQEAYRLNPSIIISDIVMPKMDGMEFCKTLKTRLETSHIPIILLTAYAANKNHIEGLDVGADDYISKPFDMAVLRAKVNNILSSRKKLQELYSRKLSIEPSDISVTSTDEIFIKKVMKTIEENMSDSEFSVEKLCNIIGVSSSQIHRKLSGLVNLNASAFIRSMRMKRAARLLETTDLRIQEIQDRVGYESKSAFIRVFKEEFGATPTVYAKQSQHDQDLSQE